MENEMNVIFENYKTQIEKDAKINPNIGKNILAHHNYFINSLQETINKVINNIHNSYKEKIEQNKSTFDERYNMLFNKFKKLVAENLKITKENENLSNSFQEVKRKSLQLSRVNNQLSRMKTDEKNFQINKSYQKLESKNQELRNSLNRFSSIKQDIESSSNQDDVNPFMQENSLLQEVEPKVKQNFNTELAIEKGEEFTFNGVERIIEDEKIATVKGYQNIITQPFNFTLNDTKNSSESPPPQIKQISSKVQKKIINSEIQQKEIEKNIDVSDDEFEDAIELNDEPRKQYTFSLANIKELSNYSIDIFDIKEWPFSLIIGNDLLYQSTLTFSINEKESSPLFSFDKKTFEITGDYATIQIYLKIKSSQPINKEETIHIIGILSNQEDNISQEIRFSFKLTNKKELIINNSLELELPDSICKQRVLRLLSEDKSIANYFEIDDIKKSIKESMGDLDKALLKLYQ